MLCAGSSIRAYFAGPSPAWARPRVSDPRGHPQKRKQTLPTMPFVSGRFRAGHCRLPHYRSLKSTLTSSRWPQRGKLPESERQSSWLQRLRRWIRGLRSTARGGAKRMWAGVAASDPRGEAPTRRDAPEIACSTTRLWLIARNPEPERQKMAPQRRRQRAKRRPGGSDARRRFGRWLGKCNAARPAFFTC